LQASRLAGDDETGGANYSAAAAVAAHGDAIAGDYERVAHRDGFGVAADRHRGDSRRQRIDELDQRQVRGSEMGKQPLEIELRVALNARDVFEQGHLAQALARLTVDELVVGAWLHAMRRGEQQIARDRGGGAGGAERAENHDDGTAGAIRRRRRAANHGRSAQHARQHNGRHRQQDEDRFAKHPPQPLHRHCRPSSAPCSAVTRPE
jgi:hypothetical protein